MVYWVRAGGGTRKKSTKKNQPLYSRVLKAGWYVGGMT